MSDTPAAARAATPARPLSGWRAKLPRIPEPVHVDIAGVTPATAFYGWLGLSLALLAVGVGLNWYLTDGAWELPAQAVQDANNPFGETEIQFLTTHPYDLLTAGLFIGSVLLLALSIVAPWRRSDGSVPYGWPKVAEWVARWRHGLRAAGWLVFALHWAATAMNFFVVEGGDWVNMIFAMASVFVLTYFAYQEFVSRALGVDNASLRFAATAVVIAASVWYAFLRIEFLSEWIIEVVAVHTVWALEAFGQNVFLSYEGRTGFRSAIAYVNPPINETRTVIIILACTAIQSMMIFVAAALAVAKADWRRRALVMAVTIPVVYALNLLRNVFIIYVWETGWMENLFGIDHNTAFSIAHNWVGKGGSLLALVAISLWMFWVLPEVVAAVIGILDLPRRRGPLERQWAMLRGKPAPTVAAAQKTP